jgi:hypothetical protein
MACPPVQGGGTNCCDQGSGVCYATTQSTCPVPLVTYSSSTVTAAFVDACAQTGHATYLVSQTTWTTSPTLSLPFTFSFFGAPVTQVWLQSQGAMGMGPPPASPAPTSFPSCSVANGTTRYAALVAFGDANLATSAQGVCTATIGAAPDRKYVATWKQATDTSDVGSQLSFSVVLSETTETIDFVYGTAQGTSAGDATVEGSTATVGIQSYQSGSLQYSAWSCDKTFLTATPLDVRFTPN